jgi:hypothetical protein
MAAGNIIRHNKATDIIIFRFTLFALQIHVLALAAMIVTLVQVIVTISGQAPFVTRVHVTNAANFVLLSIHYSFKAKITLQMFTILILLILDIERFLGNFDRIELLFTVWTGVLSLHGPGLNAFKAEFMLAAINTGANGRIYII